MDEAATELVRDWLTRASHDLQAARILATADHPLIRHGGLICGLKLAGAKA